MTTTPDSDTTVPPPPAGGFFAWIRNLDIVRSSDRWFTGVAGGIAAKAKIDPLIVRGVFVVLALLGGPGILLYLIGWLLLPDTQGRIHLEEIIRGRAQTGVLITAIVIAAVVFIPVIIGFLFAPPAALWGWGGWGLAGVPDWISATIAWICWIGILVFAGIWLRRTLLERGRKQREEAAQNPQAAQAAQAAQAPQAAQTTQTAQTAGFSDQSASNPQSPPAPPAPPAAPTTPTSPTDDWSQRVGEKAEEWGKRAGEAGERWGENFSKQADDWSARYSEHHEAHKLGAAHTIITIALALLVGGLTALWVSNSGAFSEVQIGGASSENTTPVAVLAALVAALAVCAISLIVAGIRGRHTGWVGFLAACGVIALLFTAVLPWGTRFQPFGTLEVTGVSEPGALLLAGNARIDLTSLDDLDVSTTGAVSGTSSTSTSADTTANLVVWQLTGNATVTLPDDHPTIVSVYLLAGNIGEQRGEENRNIAGPFLNKRVSSNLGTTAADSPEVTRVDVFMLAGNVRVMNTSDDSALSAEAQRNIEADREASTAPDTDMLEDQKALQTELDRLDWRLDEPGLTPADRRELEDERSQVDQALEKLELEMAR